MIVTSTVSELDWELLVQCFKHNLGRDGGFMHDTLNFCEMFYPETPIVVVASARTGKLQGWGLVDRGFIQIYVRPKYRGKGRASRIAKALVGVAEVERWDCALDNIMKEAKA